VHPDRVLIDLFWLDAPLDAVGVDVDTETVGGLLDRNVGVIFRTDIDPSIAAIQRAALAADLYLDTIGRIDEIERLEIALITQHGVGIVRSAGETDI
jgi:hypothetical protein